MNSDNHSPQGGQESNRDISANTSRTLPGHNPAIAKYNSLQIKQDTIVRPDFITLYFGFLGTSNWKRKVAFHITDRVENHYVLTARSPNQDELDAIVEHGTRSLYQRRIAWPIGSFVGAAWIYGRARLSPSWPRANPTPRAILESMRAMTGSHTYRQLAANCAWRMLFPVALFSILGSIYATFNDATHMLGDPRLKSFIEDMRKQKPEDVRKRKLQAASERIQVMRSGEQSIGNQFGQAIGHPDGYVSGGFEQDSDDTSPVNSYSEYENSSTSQSTYNAPSNQLSAPSQTNGPVWARGRGPQPEQPSGGDFFDYDDAKPTNDHSTAEIQGSPTGSAWDRLRRQNAGTRPLPTQQSQNPYGSYAEHNSSEADQFRSSQKSERDQAQAEFDKMIDAERNVGSEGSSRRRGWGS